MIINSCKINNLACTKRESSTKTRNVSFEAGSTPIFAVKNANHIKKVLPAVAFVASAIGTLGYLVGGTGLYYDLYHEKQLKRSNAKNILKILPNSKYFYAQSKNKKSDGGVKTITTTTKFGEIGLKCAKLAITATSTAGMACGLGEGIPLMALGEAANLGSASIIETPIGTGIFGIGIASIFAGLALENTPELKLNSMELMAEKDLAKKSKIILKNMGIVAKEISISVWEIAENIYKPKWIKENILQITPKTVVFREEINKEGNVIFSKMLRHNKNYLMNAASFTLALGGAGIILSSLLNQNKAQKGSLVVEEGGFLFDNFGMTKFGLDKLTTGSKSSGASFAIGGIINAASQFLGLDNKDGRALQWLGIAGVFLGFTIDRGKHLKTTLALEKERSQLTQVLREWKLDLSKLGLSKVELNKLLKELKGNTSISNKAFLDLENALNNAVGVVKEGTNKEFNTDTKAIQNQLGHVLSADIVSNLRPQEVATFEKSKKILNTCSEKIFGSANPTPIA